MVGAKGCHDDFAAAIIYIFNAVAAVSLGIFVVFVCMRDTNYNIIIGNFAYCFSQ